MGLSSDLNNVSSDSIPLLLVAFVAHGVCYIRSLFFCLLQFVGVSRIGAGEVSFAGAVGSGLAGVVLLAEQLNVHRVFTLTEEEEEEEQSERRNCVVCLCGLTAGQEVRRLACCHMFHKECLDGWLDHRNMSCPLCRAPLAKEEGRVVGLEARLGEELLTWFAPTH